MVSSPDGPVTRLYGTLLGSAYLENPVMGIVDSLPDSLDGLQGVLRPWIAVLIAVSLLLAANAVLGGSARILYSLARHHQVPAALGRVHATRMTPYVGILLFGLVAAVLLIPNDPLLLLGLFGFGAALAFTLANASIVALRYREPADLTPLRDPLQRAGTAASRCPSRPSSEPRHGGRLGAHGGHPPGRQRSSASRGSPRVWCCTSSTAASAGYALLTQPREAALPAAALSDVDYDRILVPVRAPGSATR